MPSWDPAQYARYADERSRPGLDLMARIPLAEASDVWDLGCGPGDLTARLAARFPGARVRGLDSSAEMLAKAAAIPGIEWLQGDVATWRPDEAPDLIYTNATLQWLGDHAGLIPRLVACLKPGGVFACQMPNNFAEPSHRLMRAVATSDRWAAKTAGARGLAPVSKPEAYIDWLKQYASHVDLWETRYHHILSGVDPVVEWVKGTGLRPFLDRLEAEARPAFLADYAAAIREHYPVRADGTTVFPFPRLFFVAVRA